ncbi:MAG: hypothetical protein DRG78_03845 [Epsilonproteobacteria bacterium]|nr:MAG: hypothetical protein DRG78_03845 [Campylobacterota bacterium]
MSKHIKTNIANLYYTITSKGLKNYIGMIYKDKQRYKRTFGTVKLIKAKKDLKNFRLEIINQLENFTFNDVFNEYITISKRLQSPKEIKTKLSINSNHLHILSYLNIESIKYTDCQKVINKALDKGLKPKTAKNIKAVIQVVFNFAIKQQYTDNNPATLIEIPKFDNKQYLKINKLQASELFKNILLFENKVIRDIMLFGFHARRLSECLTLQWYQVNLEDGFYTLPAQKNKSKKHLEFSMNDILLKMFKDRYKFALDNDQFSKDDYVFINQNTKTKYSSISKSFKRLKINSNIPVEDFRFHDFRHLFGTYAINELNKTIEEVSHTLGHSGIEVTQMYVTKDKNTSKRVCGDYIDFITSNIKDIDNES